jgi:membrane fusion protein, multidrug efflux system
MGFRKFASFLILGGAALALFAGFAPDVAEKYLPASGPYARQIRTYLPAALLAYHPDSASGSSSPVIASAATATSAARPPAVVVVGQAEKLDFPWVFSEIGTVQPIATVSLRPHFDATVDDVLVADGAAVKAGDVLIKLDARQADAQLKGAQAQLAKDQAQLEQAKRDVTRYTDLVSRSATPVLNLDNARTTVATSEAAILGDQAAIDNLKVQLGWYTITAPISGRVGAVNIKQGNIAKAGDNSSAGVFATINQISPIYVAFSVPQTLLPVLREAMVAGAPVIAKPQGSTKQATGKLTLIENSIDPGTGAILARAKFDNADETLWPGQLCNLQLTLRVEPNTIVAPREAVQNGQSGTYVFVIENGVAHIRPVVSTRTQDGKTVITEGLQGNETVVVDGALLLVEGSKVEVRNSEKGAS